MNISDILYFENEMRKIAAHTVRGVISFYGVMADMEREAGAGFFRCHRGYLVNLSFVAEYDSETITLSDGEKILMSKDRYHDFVKQYMRFVFYILPALPGSLVCVALYFMILLINEQGHIMDYDNYRAVYLFIVIVFAAVWLIILYGFRLQDEIETYRRSARKRAFWKISLYKYRIPCRKWSVFMRASDMLSMT